MNIITLPKKMIIVVTVLLLVGCTQKKETSFTDSEFKTILTKATLQDKIKGGWAGQVIGCTFGGPTEFRFKGTIINDYQPIPWHENSCLWYFENIPALYDDVYMDLTFVDVFEKEGLDADARLHALAFANAKYSLWHANQAARYNIMNGIMPPQSGFWLNNPHSEDIDFQIEADFAGLMSPGMVNAALAICDKVGHIMNYGDGWYGGVYVASMYSMAFIMDDIEQVIVEALRALPAESNFHKCMSDVIAWYHQYPEDWKQTWFEVEKKWSADIGCPLGVFKDYNIDAKLNAAYILIGLLYGEGDYSKTLEISTRCGQDSDCNPASAAGILGTMLGYSNIPEFWKQPLYKVEDMDFKYMSMSLNDVYEIGTKHALELIIKNGGKVEGDTVKLPFEPIEPVPLEVGFEKHFPVSREGIQQNLNAETPEMEIGFTGNGFVLTGKANGKTDEVIELEMIIDDKEPERIAMPVNFTTRRLEVAWKYQLEEGAHQVKIRMLNTKEGLWIDVGDFIVYSSSKLENTWKNTNTE